MNFLSKALVLSRLHDASSKFIRGDKTNQRELGIFKKTRIIGGTEATVGSYPYAVSLQTAWAGHFCGGSLIGPDTVLSAAHCGLGFSYNAVIGRRDLRTAGGDEVTVKTELPHPDYDAGRTDNDFMLLFLERPTTETVNFVHVSADEVSSDEYVTVMGWGDTDESLNIQNLADELMEVEVKTITNDECDASEGRIGGFPDNYNGQITENMICARDSGEDACQGDSGGPLVLKRDDNDVQVGVVSWGIGCAHEDFPGVYARVSAQYAWIKDEVCNRSSAPPSYFQCDGISETTAPTNAPTTTVPAPGAIVGTPRPTQAPIVATTPFPTAGVDGNDSLSPTTPPSSSPTSSPTAPPSPSPTSSPTAPPSPLPTSSPMLSPGQSVGGDWQTLVAEDFESGYGSFAPSDGGTKFLDDKKGRIGVVNIQDSSSVHSNEIALDEHHSRLKVTFSFQVLRMDPEDSFCLDCSFDGSPDWTEEKCWNYPDDFAMKQWIDDMSVEFEFSSADSFRIRFRCEGDSKHDDVLIDAVEVQAFA